VNTISSLVAWVWSNPAWTAVVYLAVGLAANVALGALDAWVRGDFAWAQLPRILATLQASVVVRALVSGLGIKLLASAGVILATLAKDPSGTSLFQVLEQLLLGVLVTGATIYGAALWNEDRLQFLDLVAAISAKVSKAAAPPRRNAVGGHQLWRQEPVPTP
jgi:hypothetical protein